MGLLPLRFHNVGDLSSAGPDGILSRTVLENAVGSDDASIVAPGLAPAGRHSLGMGAWGATKGAIPAKPHRQQMAEWCAVTEGSVTTIDPTGKEHTFKAGDVFLVPKGISYVWKQSEDMKKFYVEVDHVVAAEAPTALIPFDRAQPCEGDEEFWFFCSGPESLAPGSAVPVAASHGYYSSSCGQVSAGLWTCTAHETIVAEYPVHEFIFLLEGSIILTVEGEEHVFKAGDAFFIPQGLKCSWRQPTALKKCYIVYTPVEAGSKL